MLDAATFQTLGRNIASTFCAGEKVGGADLTALLEKCARDENLNPEQIARLTEATNRAVFNAKYAESKGSADRRALFQPVDAASVVSRLVKAAADQTPGPALPSYPDLRQLRRPVQEKTAQALPEISPALPVDPRLAYETLCRVRDDLASRAKIAEYQWHATLETLTQRLKQGAVSRLDFEKNAVALYGGDVHAELNALRETAGLPPLPAEPGKYAAAQEFLLGQADGLTDLLGKAAAYRSAYSKATGMLTETDEANAELRKELFGE
mgnify:CR=1 FL=1